MKKLILAFATVAFIGFGGTAVSAQTPVTPLPNTTAPVPAVCAEPDAAGRTVDANGDGIPDVPEACRDFYVEVVVAPPTTATTTTTVPVTVPAGQLPRTGSGVSPILGIGALLFVGGGIVVVATRRRTGSAPAA
jgi:LPXTG-motif cell wall-anchored protein